MKNIKTTDITSSSGAFFRRGSLEHLQSAYKEAVDSLARSVVQNYVPNTAYRLFGMINSGNLIDYNISAGALFYNGEIYLVDAAIFSVTGANVAVATIVTTFFTDQYADPTPFDDLNTHNIHEIRKVVIAGGLSGSGIANFSDFKRSNKGRLPKGSPVAYYPPSNDLSGFDATGKGISGDVLGWALCNGQNGTMNLKGRVIAGYDGVDPDFLSIGQDAGAKSVTLIKDNLPAVSVDIVAFDGTPIVHGGQLPGSHDGHRTRTDVDTSYGAVGYKTAPLGSDLPHSNLQPYKVLLYIQEID
jgi:hypothetical protein